MQGVAIGSSLTDKVSAQLANIGYKTRVENGPWELVDGQYKFFFEKIRSDADAVLVVAPSMVGFVAAGATSDYLPTIISTVTLVAKDHKEQVYRGFHSYGWLPKAEGWKNTAPKTTFSNFEAIMSNTKGSAASLDSAASGIAAAIAADLKR